MLNDSARDNQSDGVSEPTAARALHESAPQPKDLKVKIAEQVLMVEWSDGRRSDIPLPLLRRHCPCATCRTERETTSANPFRILKADPTGVRVTNARLVGNYAIQFDWSDGQNTGIFDYRFLRSLSEKQSAK